MSDAYTVGKKLVELCREGKEHEAIETLYSHHVVSVEAMSGPDMPAKIEGLEAVKGKAAWWTANHVVHHRHVHGPFPHGNRFIVQFKYNLTANAGPKAGKTYDVEEAALYTVHEGKISHEEFFYPTGG